MILLTYLRLRMEQRRKLRAQLARSNWDDPRTGEDRLQPMIDQKRREGEWK